MNWLEIFVCGNVKADADKQIAAIQKELDANRQELTNAKDALKKSMELNADQLSEIDDLKDKVPTKDPLEEYWNTKRPNANYLKYPARPTPMKTTNINVDPRIFFENNDDSIPVIFGDTHDAVANNALNWVIKNIVYTDDFSQFKDAEVWLFPFETLNLKKGDCEDGAILLASILLKSGVPYWRIRLNAGDVQGGGHCWLTYLRETDNEWYVLDWCYWPSEAVDFKKKYKDAEKYFDIWFSWNTQYIYVDEDFLREIKSGGEKIGKK